MKLSIKTLIEVKMCLQCKGIPWLAPCYPTDWCPYIEKAQKPECLETSLLEIWGYDFDYSTITREQILEEVNKEKVKSNVTGIMVEPKKMIGGVTNKDGKVISAKVKLENIRRLR